MTHFSTQELAGGGIEHACVLCALVALMLVMPARMFAALGGSEASVRTDQVVLQASLRSSQAGTYTVYEMKTPSGILIREYAAAGSVFAVAWQGPWRPDMLQLLGNYFGEYEEAMRAQSQQTPGRAGRRPVRIQHPGLVVVMGGHPRGFTGHAYAPDRLPQGVKEEEIR